MQLMQVTFGTARWLGTVEIIFFLITLPLLEGLLISRVQRRVVLWVIIGTIEIKYSVYAFAAHFDVIG